jgi:hypothetical protein
LLLFSLSFPSFPLLLLFFLPLLCSNLHKNCTWKIRNWQREENRTLKWMDAITVSRFHGQKDIDQRKPDYCVTWTKVSTMDRTDNPQVLIPAVSQRFSVKGFNLFVWLLICSRITEHY